MRNVVLVVSEEVGVAAEIRAALAELKGEPVVESCGHDAAPATVRDLIDCPDTHCRAVFLVVAERSRSLTLITLLRRHYAHLHLVVIVKPSQSEFVMTAIRAGASEVLTTASQVGVRRAYLRGLQAQTSVPKKLGRLVVFWSAQSAAGASTLASQAALSLGLDRPGEILLLDLDFHSGIVAERFGVEPAFNLADLGPNGKLSSGDWRQAVCRYDDVELIAAPRSSSSLKMAGMPPLVQLVQQMIETHSLVLVDLPTASRGSTREVLAIADRVYLVSTPELNSLYLAAKKLDELKRLSVDGDKVRLLMNRTGDYRGLQPADIETVVGLPVSQELPNEYLTVSRSIARHSRIGRMTALGRAIEGLAKSIAADSLEGRTESASPSGNQLRPAVAG